jgi:hypothetical protein
MREKMNADCPRKKEFYKMKAGMEFWINMTITVGIAGFFGLSLGSIKIGLLVLFGLSSLTLALYLDRRQEWL